MRVLKERILRHPTPSLSVFKTHKHTTQTYLKHNFIDCRSIRLKVERFVVMIAKISKFKYGITCKKQRKPMFITKIEWKTHQLQLLCLSTNLWLGSERKNSKFSSPKKDDIKPDLIPKVIQRIMQQQKIFGSEQALILKTIFSQL